MNNILVLYISDHGRGNNCINMVCWVYPSIHLWVYKLVMRKCRSRMEIRFIRGETLIKTLLFTKYRY